MEKDMVGTNRSMSDLELDKNQEKLNKLGIELCESYISYRVRNDTHHIGEMAIENYLENLDEDEEKDLTEEDMEYLKNNSLQFMNAAMKNLKI